MANKNFKDTLEALLKKDSRLVDENKELNLAAIRDLADKTDYKLIEILLSNEEATKKFFLKMKNVLVFKQNDFKFFLDSNQIDNSYTKYENKIGLSSGGRFLKDDIDDVVLNFPFKDCVLEGGQSTDEGTDEYFEYNEDEGKYEVEKAQRKEIFFNEVIAKDEIDRLEEPKAFTSIKKYTAKGEEKIKAFSRDEEGDITDNLIIKGNNLLALHCLLEEFTGKVKLICIDPPYNTGSDSFKYNDRFNHSTWLTFMKSRLETSKLLLTTDGFLCIHLDDNEGAYLKVLCDEIFGRDNFINSISVRDSHPSGLKMAHKTKTIIKTKSVILVYRSSQKSRINPHYQKRLLWDTHFSIFIDTTKKNLKKETLSSRIKNELSLMDFSLDEDALKNKSFKIFVFENRNNIFQSTKEIPKEAKEKSLANNDVVIEYKGSNGDRAFAFNGRRLSPLSKSIDNIGFDGYFEEDFSKLVCDFWDDIDFNNSQSEGNVSFPSGKKPEFLLARLISMFTNKNDVILDYFVGSGSTTCVAHKLGRRYIGIEQLEYTKELPLKRLINVVKGETTGVSELINWQGGGSFVYLELKKWNAEAKEKIAECKSLKELEKLLNELSEKYFLHYNVKLKEFKEKIIHEENFKKLPLKKQQEMFCKMLDLNQLYVNASEMEDKKYGLSKEDIALTKNFYNL